MQSSCIVRVLFTAFGTCLSSSTGFPVVSRFLIFEAPQGSWDVLLNSLKTIADILLFWSSGLIKCQDIMLIWNRCSPFLMEILFIFVTPCFSRAGLVCWVLWPIKLCRLFNAKSILCKYQFYLKQFSLT